jgi:hypothetical protein
MNVPLPLPNPHDWVAPAYVMRQCGITAQTLWRWSGGRDGDDRYPVLLTRYYPIGASDPMYWKAEVDAFAEARAKTKGHARADR